MAKLFERAFDLLLASYLDDQDNIDQLCNKCERNTNGFCIDNPFICLKEIYLEKARKKIQL